MAAESPRGPAVLMDAWRTLMAGRRIGLARLVLVLTITALGALSPAMFLLAVSHWFTQPDRRGSLLPAVLMGAAFALLVASKPVLEATARWAAAVLNARLRRQLIAVSIGPGASQVVRTPDWERTRSIGIRREPKPGEAFAETINWLSESGRSIGLLVLLLMTQPVLGAAMALFLVACRLRPRRAASWLLLAPAALCVTAAFVSPSHLVAVPSLLGSLAILGITLGELTWQPLRRRVLASGVYLFNALAWLQAAADTTPAATGPVLVPPSWPGLLISIRAGSAGSADRTTRQAVELARKSGLTPVAVLSAEPARLPFNLGRNVWPARRTAAAHGHASQFAALTRLATALPDGWRTYCSDESDGGVELDHEHWAVIGAGRLLAQLDDGAMAAVANVSGLPRAALLELISALRTAGKPALVVGADEVDCLLFDRTVAFDDWERATGRAEGRSP